MYELIENASMVIIAIIGLLLVIAPKKVVKKSVAENGSRLIIIRILGALMVVGCVIVLLITFNVISL